MSSIFTESDIGQVIQHHDSPHLLQRDLNEDRVAGRDLPGSSSEEGIPHLRAQIDGYTDVTGLIDIAEHQNVAEVVLDPLTKQPSGPIEDLLLSSIHRSAMSSRTIYLRSTSRAWLKSCLFLSGQAWKFQ